MSVRNILHLILILPTLAGLLMIGQLLSASIDYPVGDTLFDDLARSAWQKIIAEFPAELPTEYNDDLDPIDKNSRAVERRMGETNAFIVTCTLLMLAGFVGIALVTAAKTIDEPRWHPMVRAGALLAIAFFTVPFYGFNVAYPGDSNGVFSIGYFAVPTADDPVDYGMDGMSLVTDAFFFTCYIAFLGLLVITPTAGRQNATSAFFLAIPIVLLTGPVVVMWKWGAGWLNTLGTFDFAGAGLFHWHAGVVVLGIGIILRQFRRAYGGNLDPNPMPLGWWVPGIVLYLLVLVGMNTGSTLTAQPDLVAAVLQVQIYAGFTGALVAGGMGVLLRTRGPIEWVGMGAVAGLVAISGATDLVGMPFAITLGAIAGILMPLTVYACDRWLSIDPLGIFGMHGVPGAVGLLAAAFTASDWGDGAVPTAGFPQQLIFLFVVPILSLGITCVIAVLFGFLQFLFFDRPEAGIEASGSSQPPPLPPRQ